MMLKHRRFDGLIITGAPIEHLPFEDVDYWEELTEIMEWTKTNVTSVFIFVGVHRRHYTTTMESINTLPKCPVYLNITVLDPTVKLVRGFEDDFPCTTSRYTTLLMEVKKSSRINITCSIR